MSDIAQLRKLFQQQNQLAQNLPGLGIVSLRLPTAHERQMAWAQALAQCGQGNPAGAVLLAKRLLAALCLLSWSITPEHLLGERAPEEGRGDVLPVSAGAAELFFDRYPEHFEALSEQLMGAIAQREQAQEVAAKNS